MENQDRDKMLAGSGKLVNSDNSIYDFTAGFRALASMITLIFTTLTAVLAAVVRGDFDAATGAEAVILYSHKEIHEGHSFHCWYEQQVSDIGDKTIIAFRTPNTGEWSHLTMIATSAAAANASLLEAPAITDNTGASLDIHNRDRNSSNLSGVIDTSTNPDSPGQAMYFTEVTMGNVTGGDELTHAHLQAGELKKALGGETREEREWVLKQNTLYAFEIESLTDDDNVCLIELNWYEHENEA